MFLPIVLISAWSLGALAHAADLTTGKSDAKTELKQLVGQINDKLKAGEREEAKYAAELAEFDAILKRHAGEKTDAVAEVIYMKAALYQQVFDNPDKAAELLEQLQSEYAATKPGKAAADMLASIERQRAAAAIQASLVVGATFPPFDEKDIEGKPFSLAAAKSKVVLIDFWATWCGPCVRELPNVLATYEKFHDKGFQVLGISLDEDKAALDAFLAEKRMPWPQFFDGKGWRNALAEKYGITSIPMTFLVDEKGAILARDLRGEELSAAVEKALEAR